MAFLDKWLHDSVLQLVSLFPAAQGRVSRSHVARAGSWDGGRTTLLWLICVFMEGNMSQSSPPEKTKTPRPSPCSHTHCSLLVLCILGKEWAWWVLQADVGIAAEHRQQQVTWRAVTACKDRGSGLCEQMGSEEGIVRVVCALPLTILRRLGIPESGAGHAGGLIYLAVRSSHFQRL